ncbi:MAG: hypothetical protein EA407_13720 [Rhodobacteraceae bacterium]|nr:MAG: hypothetical protein EA407_13720 [Paracoccaceae bacterium]
MECSIEALIIREVNDRLFVTYASLAQRTNGGCPPLARVTAESTCPAHSSRAVIFDRFRQRPFMLPKA